MRRNIDEKGGALSAAMSAYTPPLLGPDEQAKASSGMPVATVVAQPIVAQQYAQQPVVGMPVAQVAAGGQQPMYAQPMYVQQQAPPQQYAQQQYVQQVPLQYVQPVPQQQHSSLGGDTFCSCVEDVGEACLCFWTCGCVSFGQTAERIGRTNCGLGGLLYAFFVVLIPYFLIEAVFSDPPTAEQLNFPGILPAFAIAARAGAVFWADSSANSCSANSRSSASSCLSRALVAASRLSRL